MERDMPGERLIGAVVHELDQGATSQIVADGGAWDAIGRVGSCRRDFILPLAFGIIILTDAASRKSGGGFLPFQISRTDDRPRGSNDGSCDHIPGRQEEWTVIRAMPGVKRGGKTGRGKAGDGAAECRARRCGAF